MTRPNRAGWHMADSIIEMVNLMYQKRTAINFLTGLIKCLQIELDRRLKELLK